MDPMKTRGRSKFFPCFKPAADDDHELSGDESGAKRKKRSLRSFSVALKAIFFKMSLLKKSRSENSKQDLYRLSSKLSSKSKKFFKSMKKSLSWEPEEIFRTNSSNRSSLFSSNSSRRTTSSSASSFSASSNSRSGSERIKRSVSFDFRQMSPMNNIRQKSMKKDCVIKCIYNYNPTLQMGILLVCLMALVFWGKVFAILTCTSTSLLFAPGPGHGRGRCHRFQRAVDSPVNDVIDSDDYKKRVIMEGLLERNQSRLLRL